MPKFMVELSHTPDECVLAFGAPDQRAPDFLDDVFWGCMSGIHNGWVVVEAVDEAQVRAQAPEHYEGELVITEVQSISSELDYAIDPTAAHPGEDPPFWK
jgi:hypothetical protein